MKLTNTEKRNSLKHIPGNFGLPLIGNSYNVLKDDLQFLRSSYEKYGPIFKRYIFGNTGVTLLGEEANKLILQDKGEYFSNERGWRPSFGEVFPRGILLMDGEEHHHDRKLLQSAFTPASIKEYLTKIHQNLDPFIAKIPLDNDFHPDMHIKKLLLEQAISLFIGDESATDTAALAKSYTKMVKAHTGLIRWPVPGTQYYKGQKAKGFVLEYIHRQIMLKRKERGSDSLSLLCHSENIHNSAYSNKEITDHIIMLIMVAHETSANAIASILALLGKHQNWQSKLREECLTIKTENLLFDDLPKFEQMSLVIKETLRLYPPVISIPRYTEKAFNFNNYTIPAGTHISIVPLFTQRHHAYWSHPDNFDPDRFSTERAEDKAHPFAYIPFGHGIHSCLGRYLSNVQIQTLLYRLLTNFEWSLANSSELKFKYIPGCRPDEKTALKFKKLT